MQPAIPIYELSYIFLPVERTYIYSLGIFFNTKIEPELLLEVNLKIFLGSGSYRRHRTASICATIE